MKKYTVLLLYPDYFTGGDVETYLSWVQAEDEAGACKTARKDALWDNMPDIIDGTDFEVLAVFEGHLSDLNPGAQRCIL